MQQLLLAEHMRSRKHQQRIKRMQAANEQNLLELTGMARSKSMRRHAALRKPVGNHRPLVLAFLGSDGKPFKLASRAWLRMAYEFQHSGDHVLAQVFAVSRPSVRHVRNMVAPLFWAHQQKLLDWVGGVGEQLAFVVCSLRFDCTSRTLALPPFPGFVCLLKRLKFEVLVHLAGTSWGGGGRMVTRMGALPPHTSKICLSDLTVGYGSMAFGVGAAQIRPIILLMSTSAAKIDFALFKAQQVRQAWCKSEQILGRSQVAALHGGSDNASSNFKASAWRFNELSKSQPHLLLTHKDCSLHNNDLIKTALVNQTMPVVSGLYTLATLCKGGTNFLRVLASVPTVVRQHLVVLPGATPPPEAADAAKLIVDYATFHFDPQGSRQQRAEEDSCWAQRTEAKNKFREAAQGLFDILNGDPWRGPLVHCCRGLSCCPLLPPMPRLPEHSSPSCSRPPLDLPRLASVACLGSR